MKKENIEKLRNISKQITPGNWNKQYKKEPLSQEVDIVVYDDDDIFDIKTFTIATVSTFDDTEFIIHARLYWDALLDEIEALQEILESIEGKQK